MTTQNALGKAISCLTSNWIELLRYTEYLPIDGNATERDQALRYRAQKLAP
ncbi:Transposase IS66 family [Pseudomonas meliae]|uniref:Transposase IS66 family n=1 Tax=Pseudomonas meliae TaxID=86176 RepID=A0A0P9UPG4_9PSED|nr:Transposase IS66 family [Pseudomonas meliae]